MRYFKHIQIGILITFLWCAPHVNAYVPEVMTQHTQDEIFPIVDPELEQVFFGEMVGYPHTYEIRSAVSFKLSITADTPDLPENTNTVSSIVIKEANRGRVEEVTRLFGKGALWEVKRDYLSGGKYKTGASFEKELGPGIYRIEVQTADNKEKYLLRVGSRSEMTIGYGELLSRISQVETFLGRSSFWIIESPYVYLPFLGVLILSGGVWYVRRRVRGRGVGVV